MGKTTIFFLSPSRYRDAEDREAGRGRGEGRWRPGPWKGGGALGAGKWGKTKRRSRATHSAPHLGRGRTVEGDRRRWAVCNPERHGRHWWWRWRARGGGRIGRGGAGRGGEPVRPFYRRGKAVRAKIFELQELRWPSMVVGENIETLTSGWRVPVRRGAVGSDSSCRRPLWPRRGKAATPRCDGGDRSE
jgi:hypothetical protein